ncbi:MAG: 16S rRNA (adenine(1518)-N(6)/adenine(1519)-N(6))-dimethyltransferase RsmA [Acutalibacteraceae bacterium]|nr:16S rRNA (adenine(1518)-N(6)/adenine(1519)-N(6))-dimethyltransferase RsmA [Acutalibacteraceae bacterium]
MDNLTNIKFIKELLGSFGFTFSKGLGQNFLINPNVCPRMAEKSGCRDIGVIEIGPGLGVLTTELCKIAKKVVAIELDDRLKPVLDVTLKEFQNVKVIFGDALKLDLQKLIQDEFKDMKVVICANLPYYITSPIIMELLESELPIEAITVMVQKEAAERLCAKLGTRSCGAVTAAVSFYAKAEKLFDVSRGSFMPSPNVDSSVIRLDLSKKEPVSVNNKKAMFKVIRAGFNQRRKTLTNSLSSGLAIDKSTIQQALENCGLKPTARAEELTLAQFAALSDYLFKE